MCGCVCVDVGGMRLQTSAPLLLVCLVLRLCLVVPMSHITACLVLCSFVSCCAHVSHNCPLSYHIDLSSYTSAFMHMYMCVHMCVCVCVCGVCMGGGSVTDRCASSWATRYVSVNSMSVSSKTSIYTHRSTCMYVYRHACILSTCMYVC